MSTIYILRKDVPALGMLVKVGMTSRDGEDRAREYGGGGWEIVRQFTTGVESTAHLRDLERRIHDRLDEYRCHAAREFGLTEVFTCAPNIAIRAAADEIGSSPAGDDRVDRLKKRINRGVVNKIMQQHQAAIARAHMEQSGTVFSLDGFDDRIDSELRSIHKKSLRALDACGEDHPTFRALLKRELIDLEKRYKQKQSDAAEELQLRRSAAAREAEADQRQQLQNEKRTRLYDAGRALDAARDSLSMSRDDALKVIVELREKAKPWAIAAWLVAAAAVGLAVLWPPSLLASVASIWPYRQWRQLYDKAQSVQFKLTKLEKSAAHHAELLTEARARKGTA